MLFPQPHADSTHYHYHFRLSRGSSHKFNVLISAHKFIHSHHSYPVLYSAIIFSSSFLLVRGILYGKGLKGRYVSLEENQNWGTEHIENHFDMT
jgi:hypothetical protein